MECFLSLTVFDNSIFWSTLFSEIMSNFLWYLWKSYRKNMCHSQIFFSKNLTPYWFMFEKTHPLRSHCHKVLSKLIMVNVFLVALLNLKWNFLILWLKPGPILPHTATLHPITQQPGQICYPIGPHGLMNNLTFCNSDFQKPNWRHWMRSIQKLTQLNLSAVGICFPIL